MFITKKKYEEELHKAKHEVTEQWEKKLCEFEKNTWMENNQRYQREYNERRFIELEKRVFALEKEAGLVKETPTCPCAPKAVMSY